MEKIMGNRDSEFEETPGTRHELLDMWEEGWACLFHTLNSLTIEDMNKTIYVRNMGQSVEDAIIRQVAHYAYHVGQIVYLCRLVNQGDWKSLTIPKGNSEVFNKEKFEKEKHMEHFTKEMFKK
jgi:hypothetical protein